MKYSKFIISAAMFSLSACTDAMTESGFIEPGATSGNPLFTNVAVISDRTVLDLPAGSVQYITVRGEDYYGAYAGVMSSAVPGPAITSGTATYDATWELAQVSSIHRDGPTLMGYSGVDGGVVVLTADFNSGTLTGKDRDLIIDGEISGAAVSGAMSYAGTNGALDGVIGDPGVIAAFQGNDATRVFAGGLVGVKR